VSGTAQRDPMFNSLHNTIQVSTNLSFLEPEKSNAQRLQPALALLIVQPFKYVAPPVDLDCEHQVRAKEIQDIFVDGFLPVEFMASNLPLLQTLPQ
jgi:hypothetical protein